VDECCALVYLGELQYIDDMSELLPLAEAADLLGVSVERVRQLVVNGQLPAQRFANAWAVPKDAIAARRHSPGVRGRPLGPGRAWEEILAGPIDLQRPGRYQRRANIIRCEMSRADAAALPEMVGGLLGGVRAAIDLGAELAQDDSVDLYLSAKSFQGLEARIAFVPDAAGRVVLRVVNDDSWNLIAEGAVAPRNAVALDLLESGDPRHWIAGEHLVDSDG
jgi:excisionase family DNA binding protein